MKIEIRGTQRLRYHQTHEITEDDLKILRRQLKDAKTMRDEDIDRAFSAFVDTDDVYDADDMEDMEATLIHDDGRRECLP
ncbi:MAG: hypothetical protein KJ648_07550 [Candidatus Omnitrophica bacterium]|nr:hypothetical protein [Candidatus Omnitrophota bacterium]